MAKESSRNFAEIIALGAEAALIRTRFLGLDALVKLRLKKPYRDEALDKFLRGKRTEVEAKILVTLRKLGVPVPALYYVDLQKAVIVMDYVQGILLKDIIDSGNIVEACMYLTLIGESVAKMHNAGIVHGDLTTSNMIVSRGIPYLIDFGLSKFSRKLEDIGTDIHLFIRALESTHFVHKERLLECFMKGYRGVLGSEFVGKVMETVKEIRLRGRYVEERRRKRGEPRP